VGLSGTDRNRTRRAFRRPAGDGLFLVVSLPPEILDDHPTPLTSVSSSTRQKSPGKTSCFSALKTVTVGEINWIGSLGKHEPYFDAFLSIEARPWAILVGLPPTDLPGIDYRPEPHVPPPMKGKWPSTAKFSAR
jgi:hypothetical protein